jgi:hypothetical protein
MPTPVNVLSPLILEYAVWGRCPRHMNYDRSYSHSDSFSLTKFRDSDVTYTLWSSSEAQRVSDPNEINHEW